MKEIVGRIDKVDYKVRGNIGLVSIGFYPPNRITPERIYQVKLDLPTLLEKGVREMDEVKVLWDESRNCIRKVFL